MPEKHEDGGKAKRFFFSRFKDLKNREEQDDLPSYSAAAGSVNKPDIASEKRDMPPDYDQNEDVASKITSGFASLDLTSTEGLSRNACIGHLKLLECFYRLRKRIATTDGLFGISNDILDPHDTIKGTFNEDCEALFGEKLWSIYLYRAVDRFEAWRDAIAPAEELMTTRNSRGDSAWYPEDGNEQGIKLQTDTLPAIDVLLIWHAYSLNPRCYLEDCQREGRMRLWNTRFPWHAIAPAIDDETFEYNPGPQAGINFESIIGGSWLNERADMAKQVRCPRCQHRNSVPWTTCAKLTDSAKKLQGVDRIQAWSEEGRGYADKGFAYPCESCKTNLTHEELTADKFLADVEQLVLGDITMRGTVLGMKGLPRSEMVVGGKTFTDSSFGDHQQFPNRIIKYAAAKRFEPEARASIHSFRAIRTRLEKLMQDPGQRAIVQGDRNGIVSREENIFLRRMMSRYWDNPSPFGLDLVGAAVRQGTFVTKMHDIDWLHSPSLPNTMSRLIIKYERFLSLLGSNAGEFIVPTLDVDLAWHTHQLYPSKYLEASLLNTSRFVDHDDKVGEVALHDGFAYTTKRYQELYSEPYSACTCWYCEATRDSLIATSTSLFARTHSHSSGPLPDSALAALDADPAARVHISTHNAVTATDSKAYTAHAKSRAKKLAAAYNKACVRAQKKGRPVPEERDWYWSDAYGRAVHVPDFAPFAAAAGKGERDYRGYNGHMYANDPGKMAVGEKRVGGKCVAGTCSGFIAAGGSCGMGTVESMTGGCAGDIGHYGAGHWKPGSDTATEGNTASSGRMGALGGTG